MSRSGTQWEQRPALPPSHYVDPRLYTDGRIFTEERERIFGRSWLVACHESELPKVGDFRSFTHAAGPNLVIVRGAAGPRAFFNVCPHRGNTIVYEPAGNSASLTCIFHQWSFDTQGRCIGIPREREGYQQRLCKADFGLRAVRTEVDFGGFIWVNLDDRAVSLSEYVGEALDGMHGCLGSEPLEVFSFHRVVADTNWKFWNDTNSEFYHDYIHYFNRQTSMLQPGYFDRRYVAFPNGHVVVGDQIVEYEAYKGGQNRTLTFPTLEPNQWKLTILFPGMAYNVRGSSMRVDTVVPLGPNKVAIEYRGLGLARDTPAERASRIRDYNSIWGPFGRNLHEDQLGVHGQGRAQDHGQTFIVHGREEDSTIHDEVGMRAFYAEWSRRMDRAAHDPFPLPHLDVPSIAEALA